MKNNLKTPIRDVKSSDTAYSQKTQSLEVAKSFLWRSLCYCFFQDATEKKQSPSMYGNEAYTESYQQFLDDWEASMNVIYADLPVLHRSHLIEITKHAIEFIGTSSYFRGIRALEKNHMKKDVSHQMAMYYFFKKKLDWVQNMEKAQHDTKNRAHAIVGHAGMAGQRG